ncbi:MAG: hypothetical protein ACK4PR_06805 [Gammaproteobacteria bacterium]
MTYIAALKELDSDPAKRVRALQHAILHNNLGDYTQLSAVVAMPLAEIEKVSIEAMTEANRHKLPVKDGEIAQAKWEPSYNNKKLFPTSFAIISGIMQILKKEHAEFFAPSVSAGNLPTFADRVSSETEKKTTVNISILRPGQG